MKYEITLPVLSDTMTTGRLIRWLKQPGDRISKGDVIAEMESDKAIMEIEAYHDGYLQEPLAAVNKDIPVGQVIGYITDQPEESTIISDKQPNELDKQSTQRTEVPGKSLEHNIKSSETSDDVSKDDVSNNQNNQTVKQPFQKNEPIARAEKHIASPLARVLALKLGVDLSTVTAGKDGHIQSEDVLATTNQTPTLNLDMGPPYHIKPLTLMQQTVAQNMVATLTTPTFRTTASISLKSLKKISQQHKLSLTLLLAYVCAQTINANPVFNAVYTPEGMAVRQRVDIGIAVDVPNGLLTPVIRDAAGRPVEELAEDWRILKDKIKRQRLVPEDYEGASFYLSNLGVFPAVHSFDALVPLGAAAILAIGAEHDGKCMFTLSCDHRVVSGADSARFLTTLQDYLQNTKQILN